MSKDPDHWKFTDFIGGIVGGWIIGILGIWMLLDPGKQNRQSDGDSIRILGWVLDLVWSIPGGIAFVLLGALIFGATLHQLVKQYN